MISHELKCIFIHIPRTAGSSIELSLVGEDWWRIDKKTKHLIASQAKRIYSEYWDNYFKFSFVRNPYSRMLSMATFDGVMRKVYFGESSLFKGVVSSDHIKGYKNLFGDPILLEYDYRFYKREDVETEKHKKHCVYGNILDEPIDFIGRFETLEDDFEYICNTIGLKHKALLKIGSNKNNNVLSLEAKLLITELYKEDFSTYNYDSQ